ncbi:MAG: hypothetical protein P8X89_23725 [Reinekea sp.]
MNHTIPTSSIEASFPESILLTNPKATRLDGGIDSLNAIARRSEAMLELLIEYFMIPVKHNPGRLRNKLLVNFLWQLSGNMELIRLISDTRLQQEA